MDKTLFEKIALREIPSFEIIDTTDTFAFLDINPKSPGHSLIIPKKPYENIHEIPKPVLKNLILSVQKVSLAVKKAVEADGIKIVMNNGQAAGQEIFHAHIHVIPFFEKQSFGKFFKYQDGEAAKLAKKIKTFL